MKEDRKRKKSLKSEALVAIFLCMFFMLIVTLIMSFRFYVYSNIRNYKSDLTAIADFTLAQMDQEYLEEVFAATKDLYNNMPEEIRRDPFSDEFRKYSFPLLDDKYYEARELLVKCRETANISNIYLGFYDEENSRLVLVLDGDIDEYFYIPGQYIEDHGANLESWDKIVQIMESNWYMSLAYSSMLGFTATDYQPVYDKAGNLMGVLAIDTSVQKFYDEIIMFNALFLPALLLTFILIALIISRIIEKHVIKPVKGLASAAQSYTARDKVNESEETGYFEKVEMRFTNELADLRDTMAYMEHDIARSMREIRRVSAEKERMTAELDIASEIQQSALSTDFPESDRFDLYASMNPAKLIGGDFYDFFIIDDDHLALVIADVSGKGVPAALFMMKGKEIIKQRSMSGGTPSQILEYTNNQLVIDNEKAMFITIWLGILEISSGIITASSAGHEYPFISDSEGNYTKLEDPHGVMCGAMEDMQYEDYTITVPKGGGIFVYTDGIAEAQNSSEEFFGLERIEKSLNSHKGVSAKELAELVKKDVDDFVAEAEQFDDITMLCLQMK